ncbi:MAG: hypothetical protein KJO11_09940, partial [Gemmatimonadetes bacterium]|nr:hypothetical protein [Gemmatimonadota bacterium]
AIPVASAVAASPVLSQEPEPLTVVSPAPGGFIDDDTPIDLRFNRAVLRPVERVAVFVDDVDITDLFTRRAAGMRYDPRVLPLASGEHELVVYRVTTEGWQEIDRFALQVRTALGFDTSRTDLSASGSWSTRVAKSFDPEDNDPGEIPGNVDLQIGLDMEQARGVTRISTRGSVVGATEREYALRFGELSDDAPLFDLADYSVQAARGPVELAVGHVSAGEQRHLIQGFGARGTTLAVHPDDRLDLSLATIHGNQEVGWGDLLGGTQSEHRVVTGAVGIEALSDPGALRVELTGMSGSILPLAGFNQGVVNDAEKSRGLGVRVQANALDRRVRLDAGIARSTFENPDDPELAQGLDLVAVEEESHAARYLDASFDVLRDLMLGDRRSARLTLGVRHERVDPLYRSLGAYASADRLNNHVDLQADVAGIGLQANWGGSRNNLDDVGSILTAKTRRRGVTVRVPLGRILEKPSSWMPELDATVDRTHQFGEGTPQDGGFEPSHIPDQISLDQSASAQWSFEKLALSYRWNRSEQDNRQVGREAADFVGIRHTLDVQVTAWSRVQAGVDVGLELMRDLGQETRDETIRYGFNVSWQVFDRSALSLRFSDTTTEDDAASRGRGNSSIDAQWSSVLPYLERLEGQYFLRYTRNVSDSFDTTFDFADERRSWWLDLGLNFTFF